MKHNSMRNGVKHKSSFRKILTLNAGQVTIVARLFLKREGVRQVYELCFACVPHKLRV